jgi:Flp pilus assembly pilin Flp
MRIQQRSLLRDQRGLSTVEYTVLLVLIVACAVGAWTTFGGNLVKKIGDSNTEFDRVTVTSSAAP